MTIYKILTTGAGFYAKPPIKMFDCKFQINAKRGQKGGEQMASFLPLNIVLTYPMNVQFLYFGLSIVLGIAGINRKMGFWGYLFSSILLSPLVGLLLLMVSNKKQEARAK